MYTVKISRWEPFSLWLPFLQLGFQELVRSLLVAMPVSDPELKSWQAHVPTPVCKETFLLLSLSMLRIRLSSASTQMCGAWCSPTGKDERYTTTVGVKQHWVCVIKHRPSRIPFDLSRDCFTPRKSLCKERCEVSGRETWWLWRDEPGGAPGAVGTQTLCDLQLLPLGSGRKSWGVRMSTCCRFRMASSKWQIQVVFKVVTTDLIFPILRGEKQESLCYCFAFPFTLQDFSPLISIFPSFPMFFIFFCCFSCSLSNEYRLPWLLYSTVPSTTFIYICSWEQDGKNSSQSMEILREGSIMCCAWL